MSGSASRKSLRRPATDQAAAHAGLLLQRYLLVPVRSDEDDGQSDEFAKERKRIAAAARSATERAAAAVYKHAFERRKRWWEDLGASGRVAVAQFTRRTPANQRIVIGLGNESPTEVGITLHHTYGVPIVPGSALKGLAATFDAQVCGGAGHKVLFGGPEGAGFVTFHDAWIRHDSLVCTEATKGLLADVMTPHHMNYYGGKEFKDGVRKGQTIPPTDYDDPNPVQFLSVRGDFHFVLTSADSTDHGKAWLAQCVELLTESLKQWGVGGKTSSGYGRLVP